MERKLNRSNKTDFTALDVKLEILMMGVYHNVYLYSIYELNQLKTIWTDLCVYLRINLLTQSTENLYKAYISIKLFAINNQFFANIFVCRQYIRRFLNIIFLQKFPIKTSFNGFIDDNNCIFFNLVAQMMLLRFSQSE